MFGFDITFIALFGLIALAVGAAVFAVMYDQVLDEANQEKRMEAVGTRSRAAKREAQKRLAEASKRKASVQESLKELHEDTRKKTGFSLKQLLKQAGLGITPRQYYLFSLGFAIIGGIAVALSVGPNPILIIPVVIVCGLGLPRFWVLRKRRKRFDAFLEEFPNAVDVIVRGVKAGLPLNDCMKIIGTEAKEPVAGEFRRINDTQKMGVPMHEAVNKLYENMPLAEANFFGIVISIQQAAGGNLSESLTNLSKVLRERKKMKAKIQAMSAEAKASAMIIGALPLLVATAVYFTTPDYITMLFTHPVGNILLAIAAVMMTLGSLVMRQMINFDF